jgi:hypothetical protein
VMSGEFQNCEYFFYTPGFVTIVWYFFCIPCFVTIVGYVFYAFLGLQQLCDTFLQFLVFPTNRIEEDS